MIENAEQVGVQSSLKKFVPVINAFSWQSYIEETASSTDDNTFTKDGLWEQVYLTADASDYLWYMTECVVALITCPFLDIF